MDGFKEGYEYFYHSAGSVQAAFSGEAYVDGIISEIDSLSENINKFKGFQTASNKLKGDIAEFWHSGTFNIDAAVKGSRSRSEVLRSHGLGSVDILLNNTDAYGSKYDATAADTLRQQAKTFYERYKEYASTCERSGHTAPTFEEYIKRNAATLRENGIDPESILAHDPLYGQQYRLVPSDQIKEIEKLLKEKIATESARRPELAKRYQDTLDKLTDRVKDSEGNESIPLSNDDAKEIAELAKEGGFDPADFGLTTEELVKYEYVLKQAFRAGLSAATISIVLKVAPEIIKAIQYLIKNGELDEKQFQKIGFAAFTGASEGFIRGSVSAAITTACKAGLWGEAMKSVNPSVVGVITVITMDTMKNAFAVAAGRKTSREIADELVKEMFVSASSLLMGGLVQGVMIEMPLLGFMLGSFVGSVVGSFAYSVGYSAVLSFCIDTGFTMFGLVDQNYTLPKEIIEQIGVDVFNYDRFDFQSFEYEQFQVDKFELEKFEPDVIDIVFLRRGVIGVRQIGYV
jgi:hypothetical protein